MKYFPLILRKWLDDSKIRPSGKRFFQQLHGEREEQNFAKNRIVESCVKFAVAAGVTLSRDFDPTLIRTRILKSLFDFRDAVTAAWGHEEFHLPDFTAMFQFTESSEFLGSPVFAGSTAMGERSHIAPKHVLQFFLSGGMVICRLPTGGSK